MRKAAYLFSFLCALCTVAEAEGVPYIIRLSSSFLSCARPTRFLPRKEEELQPLSQGMEGGGGGGGGKVVPYFAGEDRKKGGEEEGTCLFPIQGIEASTVYTVKGIIGETKMRLQSFEMHQRKGWQKEMQGCNLDKHAFLLSFSFDSHMMLRKVQT